MSNPSEPPAQPPLPAIAIRADADLTQAFFDEVVFRERLTHIRADSWPCRRLRSFGESVASLEDGYRHIEVVRFAEALVWLRLGEGRLNAVVASAQREALDAAFSEIHKLMPQPPPVPEQTEATVNFWTSGISRNCVSRRLQMVEWESIAANYMKQSRRELAELMELEPEPAQGSLILWQGPPGTGKTYALRALSWEWRDWCDVDYIVDPDDFLGRDPRYLMNVLLAKGAEYENEYTLGTTDRAGDSARWRLLVLEDSGELVRADAKAETGQALSRLLNVVDGLIGQGLRILVLVTTNEELGKLHPAISRPGRCLSRTEFSLLDKRNAAAWLTKRGVPDEIGEAASLADLYAIASGHERPPVASKIGFAA